VLDGGFRFENFVVGASNRLAHSAAQRVAEAPGAAYNPLVIYGGPGLGKTHLAAAIAYHARQAHPALRVELLSAEDMAERLHRAIASGQREAHAAHFEQVDLLLLDDVQFLTGQRETQSELLRLFNRMQGGGRQLVMTSDRPPAEIPDVDQRLASRLVGGLVVDVGAPDFEMRLAILRNAAAERDLAFQGGVLDEVARLALGNVRELKGALNRLAAYQQLEEAPLAPGDVRAVLGERLGGVSGSVPVVGAWSPTPARVSTATLATATPATATPATATPATATPAAASRAPASPAADTGDYAGFLADVTQEVESRVERWRVMLGEACAFWRADGYDTRVLERALQLPAAPDVNGLLATFAAAVEHLRGIEMQAVTLDPGVRGHPAFRNPEQVAEAQRLLDRALASAMPLPAPHPACTRETLEAGSANQLALKAADAIIEQPGTRYNPLFIHGPSGTGKTHLAHAIAASLRALEPRTAIACLSAGTFVEEFVAAMQEGGVERWRARYRAAEVFVLDDVQQLADKERTQEELFHLFNVLHDRGAQLVFTADRTPREIRGLADRLRSRFDGGLVVALQAPDRALRERVVRRWLADTRHGADPAVVAYLADRAVRSLRELAGLVTRLAAAADLLAVPLDLPLARRELEGVAPAVTAVPRLGRPLADGAHDAFFLDAEKVCWDWPELGDRLPEEWR
jgi:chromosomal replication initiation ATPase DnaA